MTPEATDPASSPPEARPKRPRRLLLKGTIALLLLGGVGFYGYARYYLRHVPYTVPEALRPPPIPVGAMAKGGLLLRYLGTAGVELTDGKTTIWVDPVPTRPTVNQLITGPLEPDPAAQGAMKLERADAILVNHAHFDHVLDVPSLALKTGALVIGTQSTLNLCRSRGVPEERLRLADGKQTFRVGTFTITAHASRHGPVAGVEDPMPGVIPADAGKLWYWEYTQDGTRGYRVEANGCSVWVGAGSPLPPGREFLNGGRLGPTSTYIVGLADKVPEANLAACVEEVRPVRWIANHYDNFFHPLSDGLALVPGGTPPEAFAEQVRELDPEAKVFALDYGQRMYLPPDER